MKPTIEQEKIYNFIKLDANHGIIDAVAGSGKTTTIIESISYIEKEKDLLFCAFNKSIRDEIQNRVYKKGNNNVVVKNLHQLGFDILKSNTEHKFDVRENKYTELVKKSIETYNKKAFFKFLKIHNIETKPETGFEKSIYNTYYNTFKNKLIDSINKFRLTLTKSELTEFKKMVIHYNIVDPSRTDAKILDKEISLLYESIKLLIEKGNDLAKSLNLIDLSDMLYLPKQFELYPIKKYDILFVDECQDLSKSQLAVALKYVKKNGRVIAVGDPFQSIYGFTGADIHSFERFEQILKNHTKLSLSYCFRCPNEVLTYAQNFREDIKPFKDKEGVIEKIDFEKILEIVKPKDLIISRRKDPLTILMFLLLENNFEISVHQDDIKGLINEIRFLFSRQELNTHNIFENDFDFFVKVRERNIYFAEKKAKKMNNSKQREEFLTEETNYINRRVDFLERQLSIHVDVQNINQLIKKIERLISGSENAIKLSTIHRAKGLENERVFILDYNKLPMKRDNQKPWEIRQELNLKYVALTRVKHSLFLVNSMKEETETDEGNLYDELEDI